MNRSKFYVDPKDQNSSVLVEIWVDWDANDEFRIIGDRCEFAQGIEPCNGNPLAPCRGKYELCNHHTKDLCTDEVGRLNFIAKQRTEAGEQNASFPSTITKEWARFSRETYGARSYISAMSYRIDNTSQKRVFDSFRHDQYTIKALLKSWSLADIRTELAIQPVDDPSLPFSVISNDQMKSVNKLAGPILSAFLLGYRRKTERG